MFFAILFLIIAYLIGSFPSALVVGKIAKGIDVRDYGSGNLGTTNSIRVLGKKLGFIVFFLDVFKGFIVVIIARILNERCGYQIDIKNFDAFEFVLFKSFYYGLMVVIGHFFPIFAGFKGGKAVATSLGITLAFTPMPAIACLITFGIVLKLSGYVSLSSTLAMITVCATAFLQKYVLNDFLGDVDLEICIFYCVVSLLMIIKHRKNYIRIINGTENSFKKKKDTKTNQTSNEIE